MTRISPDTFCSQYSAAVGQYSYDQIECHARKEFEDLPNVTSVRLNTITNVSFNSNLDGRARHLDGKSILINMGMFGFYHGVIGVIGQALFLKSLIPDAKFVFISAFGDEYISPFMKYFSEYLGCEEIIILEEYSTISFDSIIYLSPHENPILSQTLDDEFLRHDINREEAYQLGCAYHARSFIAGLVKKYSDSPLKIFIDTNVNKFKDSASELRAIEYDDYVKIKKYFIDRGYVVINPAGYDIEQQISIVAGATHIATLVGSNSAHSVYANPSSYFITVSLNTQYSFPHEQLIRYCIDYPVFSFSTKQKPQRQYSYDEWEQFMERYNV